MNSTYTFRKQRRAFPADKDRRLELRTVRRLYTEDCRLLRQQCTEQHFNLHGATEKVSYQVYIVSAKNLNRRRSYVENESVLVFYGTQYYNSISNVRTNSSNYNDHQK